MVRSLHVATLIGLLFAALMPHSARAQDGPGVPDVRFAHLARGINLPGWFWYGPDSLAQVERVFTAADFELIRGMGFTHVRVPVDLNFLLDENDPDLLNDDALSVFDRALADMLAHDLAVIVDIHSTSLDYDNIFSGKLEMHPEFVDTFEAFWRSFAAHLSTTDPEQVFLEILNEPVYMNMAIVWTNIQVRLAAAIRESAPEHTIIATSAEWSNINTFIRLEPLDDPNVIYNFHFYEPFWFTHQGATWAGPEVMILRGVPYPSTLDNVEPVVLALEQSIPAGSDLAWLPSIIRQHGREQWNESRIDERIALAAAWGDRHGVRLMCNEFGAYSLRAASQDRAAWIHDVRIALERYGISWAMWEYSEGFGLVTRTVNRTIVNGPIAEALGVQP
ncbi:MAG: cellulase family glycosylhydrolase [Anaerolineae bacterium]|nr:cellulase family glycosylhydrolase [Anaerolineae bacterium]